MNLTTLHRSLTSKLPILSRSLSSSSNPIPRSQTPLQTQFETWTTFLKPPFTPTSVSLALKSTPDPDTALDIFRWTAHQRGYRHDHTTYLTALQISVTSRRYHITETLIEEVLAGACSPSLPLFNTIIKFCVNRRPLFNRSFDVYKKMLRSEEAKPDLETYSLLFTALLRRFNKLHVCYVYLHPVRSLTKQMKANGVIPDGFVLNMIIKAFSKCLEVDEGMRVFREMGLYGCEPNNYTYSYLVRGMCEKGRVTQGLGLYKESKEKGLVVKSSAFMVLICSLAMGRRFEEAVEVVFDMLGNGMSPDLLSYKTLFEGMCRDGRGDSALELLEELRKKDTMMNEKTYSVYELKIGWGKSVALPSQALPAPPPGQMAIRSKEGATVILSGPSGPPVTSVPSQNSELVLTPNVPDIMVIPPEDGHLRHVIDTMALYVLDGGCGFEQAIRERGRGNPLFGFLFELGSKEHSYYIWRLYSFAQQSLILQKNLLRRAEKGERTFPGNPRERDREIEVAVEAQHTSQQA